MRKRGQSLVSTRIREVGTLNSQAAQLREQRQLRVQVGRRGRGGRVVGLGQCQAGGVARQAHVYTQRWPDALRDLLAHREPQPYALP